MATDDRRIAWLLTAEAFERGSATKEACLSMAVEAGFCVVAMSHSTASGGIGQEVEAQAARLGMQFILVNDAGHCRLDSGLAHVERRSLAQLLSRDGFNGLVLCRACDSRPRAESLLATARVLLRDLDQLDWESCH